MVNQMSDYDAGGMTPATNAKILGTMVLMALQESAQALHTLKELAEALRDDDLELAQRIIGNYFGPGQSPGNSNTLTDLQAALYNAIPREAEGHSY